MIKGDKFGRIIVVNILWLIFCLILMPAMYETNDDTGIRELINGARGVRDPHLIYQNIVLGKIYQVCYSIIPNIQWYDMIQYMVLFCSFTVMSYVLINRQGQCWGWIIVSVLEAFFAIECYVRPQYTKTAGIAAATGAYLLFWSIHKGKSLKWEIITGILLLCIGYMYREKEAIVCLGIMSTLGLYIFINIWKRHNGAERKKYVQIIVSIFVCIMLLKGINYISYATNEEWREYNKYNKLRTELLDYGFPDYALNKKSYEKLGIDKDAFLLYTSWNYNDPEKFNIPVMEELVSLKEAKKISWNEIAEFFKTLPSILQVSYTFRCIVVLGLIWIVFAEKDRKKQSLYIIYMLSICLMLYYYMYHMGRYGANRVDVGLWYSISIILGYFVTLELDGKQKRAMFFNIIMLGLSCFTLSEVQGHCVPYLRKNQEENNMLKYIKQKQIETIGFDKENLYIVKTGCISGYSGYGMFENMPVGVLDNICNLGGWECNLPNQIYNMQKYNVENPYRDAIDNENVIWIDDKIGLTIRYIRTYYNKNAEAEFIREVGDAKLYRIVTK